MVGIITRNGINTMCGLSAGDELSNNSFDNPILGDRLLTGCSLVLWLRI
jgi:hypothetical protein